MTRVADAMLPRAVVRQDDKTFAVRVEPTCRIDRRHLDEILHRLARR